jgi:hypothetical protein
MSTDETGRRQKVVMALGIATIILFSANLLTVLAKHFWPDNGLPFLTQQEVAVADSPHAVYEYRVQADRHDHKHKHRVVIRTPSAVSEIHIDQLDRDIAEMEQAARRLEREINREMARFNSENIQFHTARAIEIAEEVADAEANRHTLRIFKSGSDDGLVEVKVNVDSDQMIELQQSLEEDIRIELEQAMEQLETELEGVVERKNRVRRRTSDS